MTVDEVIQDIIDNMEDIECWNCCTVLGARPINDNNPLAEEPYCYNCNAELAYQQFEKSFLIYPPKEFWQAINAFKGISHFKGL